MCIKAKQRLRLNLYILFRQKGQETSSDAEVKWVGLGHDSSIKFFLFSHTDIFPESWQGSILTTRS